ncbi:hypothetical protein BVRB_2g046690 isoform A [Beta vulgaris subsp. vulgaris]|nr:hypothetical protein BVRB_2g046690 isoform A [Beta vulgaris subsp. vulgaris]
MILSTQEVEDFIGILFCLFLERQLLGLNGALHNCLRSAINFSEEKEWNRSCEEVVKAIADRSKDDDLGQHVLQPRQSFSWKFSGNIFNSTLFWCDVWSIKYGHTYSVVYTMKDHFYHYCNYDDCTWTINEQGINVIDLKTNKPVLWHKWNEKPPTKRNM